MNLSWTAQRGNLFLSLGVKTLWKTKLWLIRAQSNESWSWSNCVWKNREPHLAAVSRLLWSLLSSRIQLSSLQHNNPLKKNFTGAQHLHTVWMSRHKQTQLSPSQRIFQGCAAHNINYRKQIPVIIYRHICPTCNTCISMRSICSGSVYPVACLAPTKYNTNTRVNRKQKYFSEVFIMPWHPVYNAVFSVTRKAKKLKHVIHSQAMNMDGMDHKSQTTADSSICPICV